MATTTGIKFYAGSYGRSNSLTKATGGAIVFDKTTHSLFVDGVQFGGNIADATFANNVLTITKADGTTQIRLDFSDLATTSSVMAVFREIKDELDNIETAIGNVDGSDAGWQGYSGTNYLDDATSLSNADTLLDTQIKSLADTVDGLDTGVSDVKINNTSINSSGVANIAVDGEYNASTNKIATKSTVSDAIEALDVSSDKGAASISGSTITIKAIQQEDGLIKDGGTTTINLDGTYDATDNKIATKSTVSGAIDTFESGLTGTATIASKSGDVVTIKTGVTEAAGKISNDSGTDIVLEEVAVTGAAEDVSIADSGNLITATTVEGALQELATSIEDNEITIASGEKIISKSAGNELSTTLTMVVEKQGEAGNQKDYIVLKGINGAEITKVDATDFLKDGMLSNAELVTEAEQDVSTTAPYIKLTFNTDAGQQDIRFSVSSLVDTYTSGDATALTVNKYTITPNTGAVAENAGTLTTGGQVYTAIAATKGQDLQNIAGETATTQGDYINVKVTATKGVNDNNYTLSTTSNVTTHTVSDATDSNNGLATAKDVKDYVDTKVGTAVQSVDGSTAEKGKSVSQSDYATVKVSATTDSSNNVTLDSAVGLTVQAVGTADNSHMGLAEASNVRAYVDAHTANVTNNGATIPVNGSDATTLATVDSTAITAKVSFTWEEYS
jgi:hypothetical protein